MDFGSAVLAGIVATVVMTAIMYMAKSMGMDMDMPRMLGLMFAGPDKSGLVFGIGLMVHLMMGAVFGIVYALGFEVLGVEASWLWGAVFGVVHGVMAGTAMEMMPAMHPRMGDGEVLADPGPFARNYGAMMPAGIIMMHVIFGIVIGLIYNA